MTRLVFRWFSSIALGLLVATPLAALGVCALVDQGPGGEVRPSLFPFAVAALDPFVWAAVRNSATIAGLAALAAIVGGVVVGRVIGGLGGPLRGALLVVVGLISVLPPVLLVLLGAEPLLESFGREGWRRVLEWIGPDWRFIPVDPAWLGWLIAAALPGAALGALTYVAALDRLDPSWRDAARLSGGSGTRVWRRLAWPLLRPPMARIGGFVFVAALADPGPPLLLGLRRSLGYQLVAGIGDEPFPRLAALGLIAILVCATARAILRVWSGPSRPGRTARDEAADARPKPPASRLRTALGVGVLILGVGVILGLSAGLIALATASDDSRGNALRALLVDPAVVGILPRSLVLGIGAALLAALSDRVLGRLEAGAGHAATGRFRRLSRVVAPPSLVAGVVILALIRVARLAVAEGDSPGRFIDGETLAGWLDGAWAPLVAATVAAWLATVTGRLGARRPPRSIGTPADRDARIDAAVLAGGRRGGARRLARAGSRSSRWGGSARIALKAAVDVAPAVLILASIQTAVIGPALLIFHDRPGAAPEVALLAILVWAASVTAIRRDPLESTPRPR